MILIRITTPLEEAVAKNNLWSTGIRTSSLHTVLVLLLNQIIFPQSVCIILYCLYVGLRARERETTIASADFYLDG